MAECPYERDCIFKSKIIFTISLGTSSPVPQAWDSTKFFCNCSKSFSQILWLYNEPKPVLIP